MATIAPPVRGDQRVVFHNVPWETYLGLLKARGEGIVRLTYHRGVLEIMALSHLHERWSRLLHCFVVEITRELGLELASAGSTTMHADELQSGAEADESYYIRHEEIVREREEYDPAIAPRPIWPSKSISRRVRLAACWSTPSWAFRRYGDTTANILRFRRSARTASITWSITASLSPCCAAPTWSGSSTATGRSARTPWPRIS